MRVLGTVLNALAARREERCERDGHALREPVTHRRFEWPGIGFNSVADEITVRVQTCKCGRQRSEVVLDRTSLTGLTMPAEDWTKLRRDGRLDTTC